MMHSLIRQADRYRRESAGFKRVRKSISFIKQLKIVFYICNYYISLKAVFCTRYVRMNKYRKEKKILCMNAVRLILCAVSVLALETLPAGAATIMPDGKGEKVICRGYEAHTSGRWYRWDRRLLTFRQPMRI